MKLTSALLLLAVPAIAVAGSASTRIKIDTVSNEYWPTNVTMREPVYLKNFHFEVNPETVRARIVVEYTYPDELVNEREDDGGGPPPTIVQLPGLKYEPQTHAITFQADGKKTTCANVEEHKGLFGKHLQIKNTGSCFVTSEGAKHAEDDGWAIRHYKAIDTYFEVR